MASNQKSKKTSNEAKKKSNLPLLIAAVAAVAICIVAVLLPMGGGNQQDNGGDGVQIISQGESLVIPTSEVTTTASFYPIEVDGTQMEVLAVRDSQGTIRTAFNTCQICYASGRGYYVQQGNALVCQNCGNRFTVDQVEIQTGGCNPWPIFPENKTQTEDAITISYEFLSEATKIFANWKIS